MKRLPVVLMLALAPLAAACDRTAATLAKRATGYVEATEVRVSAEVVGRLLEVNVAEGDRVKAGDVVARLDTADAELALRRAAADRDQAVAQLALLRAGSRTEDIRQAQAQLQSAQNDAHAASAELDSASADVERFENLLRANAGSIKQRDDAVTRRDIAPRGCALEDRAQAADRREAEGGLASAGDRAGRARVARPMRKSPR
jgi:HlyD family secretion protein